MPDWKEILNKTNKEIIGEEARREQERVDLEKAAHAKFIQGEQRKQWEEEKIQEHPKLVPSVMDRFQVREFLTDVRDKLLPGQIREDPTGLALSGPHWSESMEHWVDGEPGVYIQSHDPTLYVRYLFTFGEGTDIQRRLKIFFNDSADPYFNYENKAPKCTVSKSCNNCTASNQCFDIEKSPELVEQGYKNIIPKIAEYRSQHPEPFKRAEATPTIPSKKEPWYKKFGFSQTSAELQQGTKPMAVKENKPAQQTKVQEKPKISMEPPKSPTRMFRDEKEKNAVLSLGCGCLSTLTAATGLGLTLLGSSIVERSPDLARAIAIPGGVMFFGSFLIGGATSLYLYLKSE